jgi:hypothetical protein
MYGSGGGLEEEKDFRETYHPLFDKYKVDLALQRHLHVYERTYPITFNNDYGDEPIVQDNNNNPNLYKNPKENYLFDCRNRRSSYYATVFVKRFFGRRNRW